MKKTQSQQSAQAVPITVITDIIKAVRAACEGMIVEAHISTSQMTILKVVARPERGQTFLDVEVDLSFRPELAKVWVKTKPLDFLPVSLDDTDRNALSETIKGYCAD